MFSVTFLMGCPNGGTVRPDLPARPTVNLPAPAAPTTWTMPSISEIDGSNSGNHIRVSVANHAGERARIQLMMEAFTNLPSTPTGFTFEIVNIDESVASTRLRQDPNPAMSADVISITHDQIGTLVDNGFISGINTHETALINLINRNTIGAVQAVMGYTGQTAHGYLGWRHYGFPYSHDTHFLVYNRNRIPEGQRHLLNTFEGIKELGEIHEVARPFGMDMGNGFYTMNFFLSYGVRLFGPHGIQPGNVGFDSPQALQAMNFVYNNRNYINNVSPTQAPSMIGSPNGDILTFITGPYRLGEFIGAIASGRASLGIRPLPMLEEGRPMFANENYKMYVVNARTTNRRLSMQVAAFLANSTNQLDRVLHRDFKPTDRYLQANSLDVQTNILIPHLITQAQRSITVPSIAELVSAWPALNPHVLAVWNGTTPTQEALNEVNRTIRYGL